MKYYKDDQNTVHAYAADGSEDDYIQDGLVAIDLDEADALRFPFGQQQDKSRAEIKRMRDVSASADVQVAIQGVYHSFQSDVRSQALLQGALIGVMAGISPAPSVWRSSDNVDVDVTVDDLKVIGAAMLHQTNSAYLRSWELQALVDEAKNQEELRKIEW